MFRLLSKNDPQDANLLSLLGSNHTNRWVNHKADKIFQMSYLTRNISIMPGFSFNHLSSSSSVVLVKQLGSIGMVNTLTTQPYRRENYHQIYVP